jgi:glucose/mannose-6-phosphate isomerase
MKSHLEGFIKQLDVAFEIGKGADFSSVPKNISSVLICGIGGSGIGGTITSKAIADACKVPVITCNDYHIPAFVNKNTLIIASSYSGNTEETLSVVKAGVAKGAHLCAITSGGELKIICEEIGANYIEIPGGSPPRTCLGFSLTEQIFALNKYGLISDGLIDNLKAASNLLKVENSNIKAQAKTVALALNGKIPVLYSSDKFEPVAIRFRQQLNENSKMLSWHNKFPEMNHNEIVGWSKENKNLAVLLFRNKEDFYRNQARMDFTVGLIKQHAASVTQVYSKGDSYLERALYFIYLTDWSSLYLAEANNVDPMAIKSIDALKAHLATID